MGIIMSQPIRILNIIGEMSPGGIEILIMNIYRNIDRSKVQFDFLQHSPSGEGSFNDEIKSMGGKIYHMPYIKTATKTHYEKLFLYIKALKHFFVEHPEYHVIHGHMTNTAAIYMPIAKKYGKVTCCIAHSHLTQARPGFVGKVTDLLHKRVSTVATDYFACSEMAAHWIFINEIIESRKVKIIKNGIDPNQFNYNAEKAANIRMKMGLDDKFVIGNVSRFKIEKNHTFQIDIFSEFLKIKPNSVLMLVGDGELKLEIEKKVELLGLKDYVKFMGIRSDVEELMLAMDVFLLPSLYEGLPVVGVEAQAMGLPVLTSTGVTKEMDITGNVWFLDLAVDSKLWAKEMLNISLDFKRREMHEYLRHNGYDITQTATWFQEFYIQKHTR